jgi:hypothetical protein
MRSTRLAAGVLALAAVQLPACTPDIATDPLPDVLEFDPAKTPPRVSEPTFALINPMTGLIDLRGAGVVVPADCHMQSVMPEAQCEFDQYLQSLDGFPTVALARTPLSAPLEVTTATVPTNVAVVKVQAGVPALVSDATVDFDAAAGYLQVKPKVTWPSGAFIWIGVRGYGNGIRTTTGNQVVASVPYNLLKRDESLTCEKGAAVDGSCKYFALLAQQAPPEAARASLLQLEALRVAMKDTFKGWDLLAGVGGIPKAEAAMLWGFPTHSGPVIELAPPLIAPAVTADTITLAVNGAVDPATVAAFRPTIQPGTVYLLNLAALNEGNLRDGFPEATATFAAGAITIKAATPLLAGGLYAVIVSNGVKNPSGKALVAPPVTVLLKARGQISVAGKSQVSSASDADAAILEGGRAQLKALLDNTTLAALTGLTREKIAYLYAFVVGAP